MALLRPLPHPDQWDLVVHLTGRPRGKAAAVPNAIMQQTPEQRLESILRSGCIEGFPPYGAPKPMVSFTETTPEGLSYLFASAGYAPWGVVFSKQVVYDAGGAPAMHVRGDEWDHIIGLDPKLRSRCVRFEAGKSEWTHEREWRVPATGSPAGFRFTRAQVYALIVGNLEWPDDEWEWGYDSHQGDFDWHLAEPKWSTGFRRWVWSGSKLLQIRTWPQDTRPRQASRTPGDPDTR